LAVNLQITTFFFAAGLVLLERDEGSLVALAVSPLSAGTHLATRIISLTALATIETVAVVLVGFGPTGSWSLILIGTAALGLVYTCFGVAIATRYGSLNALLLPAAVFVSLLLLPLLPHFGLAPRRFFLVHPIEPPLSIIRAGYGVGGYREIVFGIVGSVAWSTAAFAWGQHRLDRFMRDTRASGGR
jgi:fluoroquinolone transport system permease protein